MMDQTVDEANGTSQQMIQRRIRVSIHTFFAEVAVLGIAYQQSPALQVAGNALRNGMRQSGEFITGRRPYPAKPHTGPMGVVDVNTVQKNKRAVRMAVAMKDAINALRDQWTRLGWALGFGIGITSGYATLGAIGFEARWDYAAIGTVTNQAARLCAAAEDGQILVADRLIAKIEDLLDSVSMGEYALKGFSQSVQVHNVLAIRS